MSAEMTLSLLIKGNKFNGEKKFLKPCYSLLCFSFSRFLLESANQTADIPTSNVLQSAARVLIIPSKLTCFSVYPPQTRRMHVPLPSHPSLVSRCSSLGRAACVNVGSSSLRGLALRRVVGSVARVYPAPTSPPLFHSPHSLPPSRPPSLRSPS